LCFLRIQRKEVVIGIISSIFHAFTYTNSLAIVIKFALHSICEKAQQQKQQQNNNSHTHPVLCIFGVWFVVNQGFADFAFAGEKDIYFEILAKTFLYYFFVK